MDADRDRAVPGCEAERDGPAVLEVPESAEPVESVTSAEADAGIIHAAAPTPNAIANAPTRPTYISEVLTTAPYSPPDHARRVMLASDVRSVS